MDVSQISIIEILIAALIGMFLGAFWYSPLAFGPSWMKSIGKTPETLGSQTAPMLGSVFASILTATGVSILHSIVAPADTFEVISLGAIIGFLLIFPALLSDNLFCGWGVKLLMIQSGYRVLSVILMSVAMFYV